jgi:hypothetical protein
VLAGSVAGCTSGVLSESGPEESGDSDETATTTAESTRESTGTTATTTDAPTTHALGVDRSLPEGSVEFPDGPKFRPERPDELTAESVRKYVKTFEYRYVYNKLYYDETSAVRETCGVDSVTEYGAGFRVVVWCSASSNTERNGSTYHADYFTQYATYFVGSNSTVRYEGESATRD